MLKLIQGGASSKREDGTVKSSFTSDDPTFYALSNFEETTQSGYVQKRGSNRWRLYMNNTFIAPEMRNPEGKYYFWEDSFNDCIARIELMSGRKVFVKDINTTHLN